MKRQPTPDPDHFDRGRHPLSPDLRGRPGEPQERQNPGTVCRVMKRQPTIENFSHQQMCDSHTGYHPASDWVITGGRWICLFALTGSGLNFCCFFVFSMLSNTYMGTRKIQCGTLHVCIVDSNIERIFSIAYRQYIENFPSIYTVSRTDNINVLYI